MERYINEVCVLWNNALIRLISNSFKVGYYIVYPFLSFLVMNWLKILVHWTYVVIGIQLPFSNAISHQSRASTCDGKKFSNVVFLSEVSHCIGQLCTLNHSALFIPYIAYIKFELRMFLFDNIWFILNLGLQNCKLYTTSSY